MTFRETLLIKCVRYSNYKLRFRIRCKIMFVQFRGHFRPTSRQYSLQNEEFTISTSCYRNYIGSESCCKFKTWEKIGNWFIISLPLKVAFGGCDECLASTDVFFGHLRDHYGVRYQQAILEFEVCDVLLVPSGRDPKQCRGVSMFQNVLSARNWLTLRKYPT